MEAKGLVVSLRDQPMEVGARREGKLSWTAPAGWQTEVLTVPEGTVVDFDVALTTIDEGVLVQVEAAVPMVGECVRCVAPVKRQQLVRDSELYVYPERASGRERSRESEIEAEGDEMDAPLFIDRHSVDLEPMLRDAIFADAPLQPLCSKKCAGICVHCGILLKDAEPDHSHFFPDPRFAALSGFFDSGDDGAEAAR